MPGYNPYLSGTPYGTQDNVYGGAATNGYNGSKTNASVMNAAMQTKPVGGPEAFGRAAMMWAQPFAKKKVRAPGVSDVAAQPSFADPTGRIGAFRSVPSGAPQPSQSPNLVTDPVTGFVRYSSSANSFAQDNPDAGGILPGGQGGNLPSADTPAAGQTPPVDSGVPATSQPAEPAATTTNPLGRSRASSPTQGVVDVSGSGLDPQYQAVLQRWLQGNPEYSWLADPKYSWLVPQYFEDQSKGPNTDVVDWLHSRMQAIVGLTPDQINTMDPAYKRSGQDTYLGALGGDRTGGDANSPQLQPWQSWQPSGGTGGGLLTTYPDADRQAAAAAAAQQAQSQPAAPAVPAAAPAAAPANGLSAQQAYLRSMMQGLYGQQQEDFLRGLSAHGATTGAINSGAFQEAQSRGLADLINNQGAELAQDTFTADQNAQQRELQRAIAELESQTQIKTAGIGAQASSAAARASAAASRYKTDKDYEQFLTQLPYSDKWQGYGFQLGEDQLSNSAMQYLLSLIYGSSAPTIQLPFQFPQGYLKP